MTCFPDILYTSAHESRAPKCEESQIVTEEKFVSCVRYIEDNPVQERLVVRAEDYPYTSAGRGPLDTMPLHLRA